MLRVILTIVQVFSCFAIIGLVLLQRGKGAEAGAGFGAGASGTVFGARGAGTALSRATAIFVAIFMINSLLLTYMGTHSATASQPKSILDTAGEKSGGANKQGVTTTPAPAATGGTATAPAASVPADNGSVAPTPAPTTPVPAATAPASAPPQPAAPNGAAPK
jgi:preprotein translocase subunit SecG